MREISVSVEVFARIWMVRRPGEQDENAVLERVLREHHENSAAHKFEGFTADDDYKKEIIMPIFETKAHLELAPLIKDAISPSGALSAHASWWEVVFAAIERLGGEAQLYYIYREVERICVGLQKRMPKELEATVRGTLEDNCAESHRYKHVRDVFKMTKGRGQGTWGIEQQ